MLTSPRELGRSEIPSPEAREPERLGDFPEVTQLGCCIGGPDPGSLNSELHSFLQRPLGQSTGKEHGLWGQTALL